MKQYKAFVTTRRPAGGAIRVVLVDEPTGWVAFFCTNLTATVADAVTNSPGEETSPQPSATAPSPPRSDSP